MERLVAYYQGEDIPIDDLLSETCNSLSQKKDALIHRLFEILLFDYFNSEDNLIYFPVYANLLLKNHGHVLLGVAMIFCTAILNLDSKCCFTGNKY